MTPQGLFVATVAVCLVNGMFSPMLGVVWLLHPVWLPELLPATREIVFYGAALIVSTGTLLLSALPAAIAERLLRLSPVAANGVWFGAALLLSLPGLAWLAARL
jgi:hypothetical protein